MDGSTYLDGNIIFGGAINAGGQVISNLADPVNAQDAVTKAYYEANTPTGVFSRIGTTISPTIAGDSLDLTGELITFDSAQTFGGSTLTQLGYLSGVSGLGSLAQQTSSNVAITGGLLSNITSLNGIDDDKIAYLGNVSEDIQTQFSNLDIDIGTLDSSKQDSLTLGNITGTNISVSGGTGAVVGSGVSISIPQSIATTASPTFGGLTLGASGLNMSNYPIANIGNANTDFTGTGGLTLADALAVSAGGIEITGSGTFLNGVDVAGSLTASDITTTGNADVGGDLDVTGSATVGGADENISGANGYIDFNENTGGVTITPRIIGTTEKLGFRSMVAATSAITSADSVFNLHTAIGYITPYDTTEVDPIGGNTFIYKNVASSEVEAKGEVWKINGGSGTEYICTGTVADTCAEDTATSDYSFIDGSGNGLMGWGWVEFAIDASSYPQYIMAKRNTSDNREWWLSVNMSSGSGYPIFGLRDENNGVNCNNTSSVSVSAGWHQIGFIYDGAGGVDANDHSVIFVDGVRVATTNSTCTSGLGYAQMRDGSAAFSVGDLASGGATSSWNNDIGPAFIAELPGATNLLLTPEAYDDVIKKTYQIGKVFLGL